MKVALPSTLEFARSAALSAALCVGLLGSCAGLGGGATRQSVRAHASELGTMRNVVQLESHWFGGGATDDDLELARRRGIERVIDLRRPEEARDALLEHQGLERIDVEVDRSGDLTEDALLRALAALAQTAPATLVLDVDGTRAATLLALHRVRNDGLTIDEAIEEARIAGLRDDGEALVRRLAPGL